MTKNSDLKRNFLSNFSYTITSNLISLIISSVTVLVVPKILGVAEYGYYQLYLFYVSYVGLLQLGWVDGIYLKYGGKYYEDIDKPLMKSQFLMISLYYILVASVILVFVFLSGMDIVKKQIIFCTLIAGLISSPRGVFYYVLQATSRLKEYSKIIITGRLFFIFSYSFLLIIGKKSYQSLIISELLGQAVPMIYSAYICKDIFLSKTASWKYALKEAFDNISIGYKLMIANIASQLIIGVVRFLIEQKWGIETFGKVSLTLSISNLLLVFINAIGIVMFPTLRRVEESKLSNYYINIRMVLMPVLFTLLLAFYPLKFLIGEWLPQYAGSLYFMGIVFPVIIYESKMSLLINSYLRTLRQEKLILKVNLLSFVVSGCLSAVSVFLLNNINLAVISILVGLAFRSVFAELKLMEILNINETNNLIIENILVVIFVFGNIFLHNDIASLILYFVAFICYLFIHKRDLVFIIDYIKKYVVKKG